MSEIDELIAEIEDLGTFRESYKILSEMADKSCEVNSREHPELFRWMLHDSLFKKKWPTEAHQHYSCMKWNTLDENRVHVGIFGGLDDYDKVLKKYKIENPYFYLIMRKDDGLLTFRKGPKFKDDFYWSGIHPLLDVWSKKMIFLQRLLKKNQKI